MTPVSIIIPCFNQARFVGDAIESALKQTWDHVEIVVVDDGSTDGSGRAIAAAAEGRPTVRTITQPNQGLSAARNTGLDHTWGEIVIFLDADDRLLPDAARIASDCLAGHPNAMMTFGACRLIDESGAPMLTNLPRVESNFYSELLRRNFIWTPAMAAFRRDVFDVVGRFDRAINASADYDMYLRIARLFQIVPHHQIVTEYRQHTENMSRNPTAMLDATLAVLDAQRPYVRTHHGVSATFREGRRAWRAFYGEQLVERFRSALHARRYAEARQHALHLLRLYPRGVVRHLARKARVILRGAIAREKYSVQPIR